MSLSLHSAALPAFAPTSAMRAPVAAPRLSAPQMAKSQALPFLECPAHLDGSLAGDVGFDPYGFGSMYNIKYMREAELKHGRICMLAFFGYISVDRGFYAPGAPHVSSLAAHDVTVQSGHMVFLLFVVGILESLGYTAINQMLSGETEREPGDYGLDGFNYLKDKSPAEVKRMQFYEIVHCRAAMLAFSGMVTVSAMYGKPFPYF
ncbi:hypothetical protein AB1Y20_006015 [Prymnesium parvum]